MNFYTTSTFRQTLTSLTKKPKEGYKSVVKDVTENNNKTLHQVDIKNALAELDTNSNMF